MRRIIDGKTYNTDTSTRVARYQYEDDKDYAVDATVYQNRGGAFFIVHQWLQPDINDQPVQHHYFEATDRAGIERLILVQDNLEILDERALAIPPEAVAEEEPAATAYLRLPPALKNRIDAAAKQAGLSVNAWAIRCFENCTSEPRGNA